MKLKHNLCLCLTAVAACAFGEEPTSKPVVAAPSDKTITADFARPQGIIRPLHGVNGGPVDTSGVFNMSSYWKELAIPSARLNPWPTTDPYVVDIPLIFPLFHLDPDNPENYLFGKTDDFIAAILKTRAQIVYRLGTTGDITPRKAHTQPPADLDKWARIAVNIIRHYNEGWAGGFHHDIRYWEIWNEPDGPNFWTGTAADYFRLYETAARAIKKHDPSLKVGGPAVSSPHGDFMEKFLAYCRDRSVPLDFFSWHTYATTPFELQRNAEKVRAVLDRHGFKATESHLNEWHYYTGTDFWENRLNPVLAKQLFPQINGPEGAAFNASALILFQDSPVDVANYYSGDILRWGLFATYGVPNKCYFSFKAFRWLLDTPRRVACEGGEAASGLAACAGLSADGKAAALLLSNFKHSARRFTLRMQHLPWTGRSVVETFVLDADHDLTLLGRETRPAGDLVIAVDCPSPAVRFVRLTPAP